MIEKNFYYPEDLQDCTKINCEMCMLALVYNKCYDGEKLAEAFTRSIKMLHRLEI